MPLEQFISDYVKDSTIKQVIYDNDTDKWVLSFNHAGKDMQFDSMEEMIAFVEDDFNSEG